MFSIEMLRVKVPEKGLPIKGVILRTGSVFGSGSIKILINVKVAVKAEIYNAKY